MFFDTVIIFCFGESSGNAWQWLPYKKIPTFAQNNIALKPMVNVWISRYFSITVSVLIVDEISGEEPGVSSLIMCIIAWSQNWCLNNTSWVTPSHKWSRDLETLILNNYRVLPQVQCGVYTSKGLWDWQCNGASNEGKEKTAGWHPFSEVKTSQDCDVWHKLQAWRKRPIKKCECHYVRTLMSF